MIPRTLIPILERALGLPKGIVDRDAEWANAKPGDPPWPDGKLAEAYLLAGMDRRALLRRVGLVDHEDRDA